MVREKVVTAKVPDGTHTIVAVCKKCLTDEERKEWKLLLLASPDKSGGNTLRRPAAVAGSAS
jgi:hypothetical protein